MVSDVINELKELSARLEAFGVRPRQPLLQLRTGELVTQDELTRRADEQRRQAEKQRMRGMHPIQLTVDEWADLDPIF